MRQDFPNMGFEAGYHRGLDFGLLCDDGDLPRFNGAFDFDAFDAVGGIGLHNRPGKDSDPQIPFNHMHHQIPAAQLHGNVGIKVFPAAGGDDLLIGHIFFVQKNKGFLSKVP